MASQEVTPCPTHWLVNWHMLALIGCTWNECPDWSASCMPPVVPPHLGPAPAGLLSLVWAVKKRSASTSERSTPLPLCRAARLRKRRRKAKRDRGSLRARQKPPAAPAPKRKVNPRATQSQVTEVFGHFHDNRDGSIIIAREFMILLVLY